MNLKSRGIFKNFSVVFLLLIIIITICVPLKEVNAASDFWPSLPSIGDLISFNLFSIIVEFIANAAADEDTFLWPIYFLAYQFFNICLLFVTILVYFGAWLVDVFLDENIYIRVLDMTDKTSAVYIGWTTVRDACNTFFILFLLLIAFSTILRIQAYNAKNLLPKLIISLFLINFSAIIAMMVIDLGQVFMFEIKTWMGAGFSEGGKPLTSMIDYFNSEYNFESPTEKYLLSDVVGVAFAVAYSVILGLLYIMLALFLMVRIVVFVILVIISPFAFFSIILPGMRTYTSQWWSSLVSHAIFGPIFLFFIFLSGKMAQSMQTFEPIAANDEIDSLSYIIAELIPHFVALALLAAAIPVTQKLGAAGSSKIIGGAAGLGKVGIGVVAGAKLLGGGAKKVGGGIDRRTGRRMSDWGRKKKEDILLKVPGGLGMGEVLKGQAKTEKKKEENMKEIRLEFGTEGNRNLDMLKKKANKSSATTEDRAVYAEEVVAQKKMGDKEYSEDVKRFMPEIERTLSGNDLGKLTDRSLSLTVETAENKKKIKSRANNLEGTRNEATGKNYTRKEAEIEADLEIRKELVNDLVEKGETHKLQDTNEEATAKAYREVVKGEQRKSDMSRMSPEQRAALAEGYLKNIKEVKGTEEETRDIEEDNMDLSSDVARLGKGLEESFAWGGDDAAEKIKEAFPEFNHKDVTRMSSNDLDRHGYSATKKQIDGLNKAGEYKTVRRIKASMEKYDSERLKQVNNSPTNPTDEGSGGGGGTKSEEPGKKWKEKMKERTGGGGSKGSGSGESSKKNKKSFLGDENAEANLTSAIPKKTKREKEGGGKVKKDRGSRAAIIDDADTNKPRRSFWKDESASVGLTGSVKSKTITDKKVGAEPQQKEKKEQTKFEKIREVSGAVNAVASGMSMKDISKIKSKDPDKAVRRDKAAMKILDVGSKLDKRMAALKIFASPMLKKQLEIDERRQGGEKISQWQEDKEKLKALTGLIKPIMPKDSKEDGKYIGKVGKALSEAGENTEGKTGTVLKAAGKVLQSEKAQEIISKEVRKKADEKEDENPVKQSKSKDALKQWAIKETKEKIIEVKESVSKDGLKSTVVKSEIAFDPTKMSKERAGQIKEAMKGMSNDMKQEITNNIAVNSSQEAVDINFEKIIDTDKIAKLIEKEIKTDDVEKTLKKVQKSFDKFKENNGENASATVFGAGISAAQTALEKAQNREDHKEQAVELATIENVLGEIESGMKKQGKDGGKEKE